MSMQRASDAASFQGVPQTPDEFYVGYLKTPSRLRQFLTGLTTGLLAAFVAAAWLLSPTQNNPGNGVWHDRENGAWTGSVQITPYPMIRVEASQAGGAIETILLVDQGKIGAKSRAAAFDGRIATVRGTVLERDGHRLIELAERDGISVAGTASQPVAIAPKGPQVTPLGIVTLRGEIIDPKCYCGAMKPGEGKPHKECATRCIAGGIPPMFVTIDSAGEHTYFLLTDKSGRALDERILPYVADAVEIAGVLELHDDLCWFKIDPAAIRRL